MKNVTAKQARAAYATLVAYGRKCYVPVAQLEASEARCVGLAIARMSPDGVIEASAEMLEDQNHHGLAHIISFGAAMSPSGVPLELEAEVTTYTADGFDLPHVPVGIKITQAIGIDLPLLSKDRISADVYIERRNREWVINVSPKGEQVEVVTRIKDDGTFASVIDH